MDSEKPVPNVGTSNAQDTSTTNPPAGGGEFRAQRGGMPPPPFFQGFHGGHMPFLFPPSFMQPVQGVGFPIPLQSAPPPTIDLTAGSEKRGSQECATEPSKTIKKQRLTRKKPEIVELDDAKAEVDAVKCQSGGHWKDHWVIQLITIRGEMHSTFSAPPKQGVDSWSRVRTKLVSLCPDFTKDKEACRKKWSSVYNDYKEDKAMNLKLGSQRSEKCRWFQLVDEYMANVVTHAHTGARNANGLKSTATSETNTTEQRSGESTSKSPAPKRKEDIFLERCIGEILESNKILIESFKASEDRKLALLMSMQQTLQKLVDKL